MDEKDLYNKIIQAANIINNCNRSIGDYIVVRGSKKKRKIKCHYKLNNIII